MMEQMPLWHSTIKHPPSESVPVPRSLLCCVWDLQGDFHRGSLLCSGRSVWDREWIHLFQPQHWGPGHHKGEVLCCEPSEARVFLIFIILFQETILLHSCADKTSQITLSVPDCLYQLLSERNALLYLKTSKILLFRVKGS